MNQQGVLFAAREGQREISNYTPVELREALHLAVGDVLEATIEQDKIVLTPKAVVDRTAAWDRVIAVLDRVHAKLPPSDKDPKAQEEEIAQIIKEYRKKHAERRS
jgi:bifunctional DNA-binding transcriptional regulator/antitoxin component of YhaV-PrlF toxin-antitoxin module